MEKINVIMFSDVSNDSQENETKKECCKSNLNKDFFKEFLNNCDFKCLPAVIKCYCNILKKFDYEEIANQVENTLLKIYHRNSGVTTRKIDKLTENPTINKDFIEFKVGYDNYEISKRLANRLMREYNVPEENFTWHAQTLKIKRFNFDITLDSTINKIIQQLFTSDNHSVRLDNINKADWEILFLMVSQRLANEHRYVNFEWLANDRTIRLTGNFKETEEYKRGLMVDALDFILKAV